MEVGAERGKWGKSATWFFLSAKKMERPSWLVCVNEAERGKMGRWSGRCRRWEETVMEGGDGLVQASRGVMTLVPFVLGKGRGRRLFRVEKIELGKILGFFCVV